MMVGRHIGRVFGLAALVAIAGLLILGFGFHAERAPRMVLMLLLVVLVVQFAGATFAALGARRLARPLEDLVDAAQRVAAGDYATRVDAGGWGPPSLRRLLGAFNTMAGRLEANADQRQRLLADTSHELRTPLTALQGELEAMLDGVHPADPAHLRSALEETHVLARLIDDLRTVSLAEAGALRLEHEPVDVAALARDVAAGLDGAASEASVRVVVHAPETAAVTGDALRLRQVISNLAVNALRYAPRGSEVTVDVAEVGGEVSVTVEDRGPGIAPEVLPHVFERFARGDGSAGSGLGLAIARGIVEAHGGTIVAERPAAGGTRIRFAVPIEERQP